MVKLFDLSNKKIAVMSGGSKEDYEAGRTQKIFDNHREYCNTHGYDYICYPDGDVDNVEPNWWTEISYENNKKFPGGGMVGHKCPTWNKIAAAVKHFDDYDYLLSIDNDAVFTNMTVSIEDRLNMYPQISLDNDFFLFTSAYWRGTNPTDFNYDERFEEGWKEGKGDQGKAPDFCTGLWLIRTGSSWTKDFIRASWHCPPEELAPYGWIADGISMSHTLYKNPEWFKKTSVNTVITQSVWIHHRPEAFSKELGILDNEKSIYRWEPGDWMVGLHGHWYKHELCEEFLREVVR